MESDVTQSELFYKLWAWGDKNKKQLLWGLVALAIVGLGIAFWFAHQSETQNDANDALSKLTSHVSASTPAATPDALLKLSSDYSGSDASQRALLLAATDLFTEGKYDVAAAQFQKFLQQYSGSPLVSQAALGVAACYDAQGKTNDAVSAYQSVADRYPSQNVAPQAKLGLARLLEAQGKIKEARVNLEEITRTYPGSINTEAAVRLQALNAAHPEVLENTNRPAATAPMMTPAPPTSVKPKTP